MKQKRHNQIPQAGRPDGHSVSIPQIYSKNLKNDKQCCEFYHKETF